MIKTVIGTCSLLYKARNRCIHVVNAPKTINIIWKVVSTVLDEFTANKVNIIGESFSQKLLDTCHPS